MAQQHHQSKTDRQTVRQGELSDKWSLSRPESWLDVALGLRNMSVPLI